MNQRNPLWMTIIVLIFILAVLNIVMNIRVGEYISQLGVNDSAANQLLKKSLTGESCPDSTGGSENAYLRIKYFYSKYCPWCTREEPILQEIVEKYGNLVQVSWYDVNKCPELVAEYKVSGVPTTIFHTFDNETEYSHYGFIYKKDLRKLVCDVTGGCI